MTPEMSIRKFLSDVKTKVIAQQRAMGIEASGRSADSLRIESTELSGELYGAEAFRYQQDGVGRKPGNMPPIKSIEQWIKDKGLELNAWAVAKSIAKKGTTIYQRKRRGLTIGAIVLDSKSEFLNDIGAGIANDILTHIRESAKQ